ncbi:MAG: helix-turn-helix transcriptional regulator [Elusimicrobiota bacterium]|jgi:transcriptional regulator with XRE-family HTH domain|nr:helix-turn-helix transcriptional regulator [Elusimicrobiota bacterium]
MPNKEMIKKLRMAMAEIGFSQADLAKKLSVSRVIVNRWMQGDALPSTKNTKRIAEAVKKPLSYFLDDIQVVSETGNSRVSNKELELLKKEIELQKKEIELLKKEIEFLGEKLKK